MIFFFIHIHDDAGLCCCRVVYTINERLPNQTKHKSRPVSSPHRLLLCGYSLLCSSVTRICAFLIFLHFPAHSLVKQHQHTRTYILADTDNVVFLSFEWQSTATTGRAAALRRTTTTRRRQWTGSQKPLVCHHQWGHTLAHSLTSSHRNSCHRHASMSILAVLC